MEQDDFAQRNPFVVRERAKKRALEVLSHFDVTKPLVGAEIGVFCGLMSYCFLSRAPRLMLYMVDSWLMWGNDGETPGQAYALALFNTDPAKERTKILKMDSLEAATHVADHSLDFAFIDADHSYEAAKADIHAWQPKVKPGGWLCGHDYGKRMAHIGVDIAVDEYVKETKSKLETGADWTWFIRQ